MSDQIKALNEFAEYLDKLDRKFLALISKYYARDVRYRDPIHDVQGVDKLKSILSAPYEQYDKVKYKVISAQLDPELSLGLLRWDCLKSLKGKSFVISGMSEVTFNKKDQIISQVDFWDSGELIENSFPLTGKMVRAKRQSLKIC